MPRKAVRGRKKGIVEEVQNGSESEIKSNGQDLNVKDMNKISEKKENKTSTDIPAKNMISNGQNNIKASETVEEKTNGSSNSSDTNASAKDKIEESENTKDVINVESHLNSASEKDSNLNTKIAPLKRGRKKANAPAENVEVLTETVDSVPVEKKEESLANQHPKSDTPEEIISDVAKNNDKTEPDTNVAISDDKNKIESKDIPLKRVRPKRDTKDDKNEPGTKVDISDDKNKSESKEVPLKRGRQKKDTKNDKTKPDTEVDVSDDENKPESKEAPLKRGRPKRVGGKASEEHLQTKEKIPATKREQKKASDLKKIEVNKEKIADEQFQVEEKVSSKRGRKKANIPLKSDNSSDLKKIEEELEDESSSGTKEVKTDVTVPKEEQKMSSEHDGRKANQKETVEDFSDNESNVDLKESSKDIVEKKNSGKNAKFAAAKKNVRGAKNEKQEASQQSKELSPIRHKRKNETPDEEIEKNKNDFNETKILKVAITRNLTIDKMFEEQSKVTEKGGAKNKKTGNKRAKDEDTDSNESDVKAPKIPKSESQSKGQSKKDKMPDVTLLDFSNNSTSPTGKPWNLKISSWNVNGIRAWLEKDGLAYITHESPDIMAFQETKCSDKMLPEEVNIKGYHSYWLAGDKDGYSGVGLLSKEKPMSVNYGIGVEEHDSEGRVITAEYEKFYFVTVYIPNAGRKLVRLDYRMQWDKDFCSYLKSLEKKKPVILCGDLNVAHEEIDLANPKTNKKNAGFTKEEREGFSALLSEGFIDSFRHLYPEEKGAYTFWTYMMNARAKNVGWRLDYFVLSKKFTDQLCDSVIRKDVFGSDHCPITLFLCV